MRFELAKIILDCIAISVMVAVGARLLIPSKAAGSAVSLIGLAVVCAVGGGLTARHYNKKNGRDS